MRFIYLLFTSVGCFNLVGQKTPQFLTTFYFEDAIGNLDSIEIGFDSSANNHSNPDFGELSNLSPFDSVFDVRAVNYFEYYNTTPPINTLRLLSGRIVGNMEKYVNSPCYTTPCLIFFIHAKYQPITISVKSVSIFQKIDCPGHNTWNFFSPDRLYHFIEPWGWAAAPGVRYGCLKDSIYSLYLDNSHIQLQIGERPYLLNYEVEGKGIDSIFGVCFERDQSFYQCDSTYVISTEDKSLIHDFSIYPNPLSDYINIQIQDVDKPANYEIFNQMGTLVHKFKLNNRNEIRIDVQDLPTGIYFMKLNYKADSTTKVFVKI